MIETFYSSNLLDSTAAFLVSLILGILFGVALEKAGFGSSRRLSGIFYFRDMTVLKVMFTAMITAMLGLFYVQAFGIVSSESIYLMPTIYVAQIIGGLIFGVGFVMSGWCPGTAAVGMASGKLDAVVCVFGIILGSILFNETFSAIKPLYTAGDQGVLFLFDSLRLSKGLVAFLFTVIGIAAFWGVEKIEKKVTGRSEYLGSPFLKTFSFVLFVLAFSLLLILREKPGSLSFHPLGKSAEPFSAASEQDLMQKVEEAKDHIEPEELADRLLRGNQGLIVADIRPEDEYARFHIKGAMNISMPDLSAQLMPYKNQGMIVLYSNGMTHPAQARDSLDRQGFENVYLLTDGLDGFIARCLKPVSLRSEPVPDALAKKINSWQKYFLNSAEESSLSTPIQDQVPTFKGLVESQWLLNHLKNKGVKILDLRSQPEYNKGHIHGSLAISPESFRGVVKGVPSVLLPARMLSQQLSLMGITPHDFVVLVYGEKSYDATLVGMVLERLGHKQYGILNGGFLKWQKEEKPVDTDLPEVTESFYPSREEDSFTVDYKTVLKSVRNKDAVIIDVRPEDFFLGKKSDEARAGHIPGAINRPFSEDIEKRDLYFLFKPLDTLALAYQKIIPDRDTKVIVHCRTGHQASQTFFILKNLLGYKNIYWYDAGWTEWAARKELPIE